MIIGENNILQTGYEKHFHRRQDSRSYLNEQFRLNVDTPYIEGADEFIRTYINSFIEETISSVDTVAKQIEYGKKISKEILPSVLKLYLNNYILRANDFNINDEDDLNF